MICPYKNQIKNFVQICINIFCRGRSVSSENSESDQNSEKSPLVSTKLDSLAKLIFSKSLNQDNGTSSNESPTRLIINF